MLPSTRTREAPTQQGERGGTSMLAAIAQS